MRYYRSDDATIDASDTEVGTDDVSSLSAGGTSAESISLNAPSDAGTYYYGACVESVSGESNTDNNCSLGVITVTHRASGSPDLIVESPSVNDNTLTTGQSFTFSATVRNQGSASSGSTTLRYYRSLDATISTDDTEVGTDAVSSLSAGGTSAESISLNAPSSAGTYYYGACVESVSGESNTGNNCSSGVSVTVGGSGSPDLIVESPSVNDNTPTTGQSITFSATVRNQGNASSASTTLRYYRSSNATITTGDTEVGTDGVSSLSAGGTSAESISLNAPSDAGTYYYGACVESVSGESNTGNNCSSGVSVTVGGSGPPAVTGKLYWTELNTESIRRSNLDGSGIENLVTTGLDAPLGIALDVAGGKMYWTDATADKIQRSNLDGSGVEDLITGLARAPSRHQPECAVGCRDVCTTGRALRALADESNTGNNLRRQRRRRRHHRIGQRQAASLWTWLIVAKSPTVDGCNTPTRSGQSNLRLAASGVADLRAYASSGQSASTLRRGYRQNRTGRDAITDKVTAVQPGHGSGVEQPRRQD